MPDHDSNPETPELLEDPEVVAHSGGDEEEEPCSTQCGVQLSDNSNI